MQRKKKLQQKKSFTPSFEHIVFIFVNFLLNRFFFKLIKFNSSLNIYKYYYYYSYIFFIFDHIQELEFCSNTRIYVFCVEDGSFQNN